MPNKAYTIAGERSEKQMSKSSNSMDKEASLEDSQSRSKAKISKEENKAYSSQYSISGMLESENDMEFPEHEKK